jgi:hypothetical protein
MRAWTVHLCWALIAVAASGAGARWSVSRREAVVREREVAVGLAPSEAPMAAPPAPQPPAGAVVPAGPGSGGKVRLPSDFHLLPDPNDIPLEEILRLMKCEGFRELYRALSGVENLKDRALQHRLYLELLHCPEHRIRQMALGHLASSGGADVVAALQETLRTDPEPYIRALAAQHLGTLPDQGTVVLLLSAYRDGDEDLKLAAAGSLYRFGHPGEVSELLPGLAAELDSPDGSVRKDAVERLSRLKVPDTIPLLTRALRDTNGDVRSGAADALGELDDPGIPSLLAPLLQDPLSDVRESAKDAVESYRKRHPE